MQQIVVSNIISKIKNEINENNNQNKQDICDRNYSQISNKYNEMKRILSCNL